MVFASDFNDESYYAFEKIKSFADIYDSHIDLLKVITPREFETTRQSAKLMNDFVFKFNLKKYSVNIYNDYNIEQGIIDFSDETNADLVALETHGRTGIAHLILGSLTESLVKHESRPVLSIKMVHHSEYGKKLQETNKDYQNWGAE